MDKPLNLYEYQRTTISLPDELREKFFEFTPFYKGCRTDIMRKIYFDIDRFAQEYGVEELRRRFLQNSPKYQDIQYDSYLVNLNFSVHPELYKRVTRYLANFRSTFVRMAIEFFISGMYKEGNGYLNLFLNHDTKLENYFKHMEE